MRYCNPDAPAKGEFDDLQPLTLKISRICVGVESHYLEQASMAEANAAVAEDIASRAFRYALAAAINYWSVLCTAIQQEK